jgi:signal peptidase I
MKKIVKFFINIIRIVGLVVLIFSIVVLISLAFSPVKSIHLLRVMSGSMEPNVQTGSIVVVKNVPVHQIQKGDVITYTSKNGTSITHRVVEIKSSENNISLVTKGDLNNIPDVDPISENQIKGKVLVSIPYIGYMSIWMKTPKGFSILVILPALFIIGSEIWNILTEYEKMIVQKIRKEHTLKKIDVNKID